jgi:dephospho-CoA kinase
VILVRAPFPVRFFRALRRDKIPPPSLLKRFLSQRSFGPQYFSGKTDIYTVCNSGLPLSGRALESRLDLILKGL